MDCNVGQSERTSLTRNKSNGDPRLERQRYSSGSNRSDVFIDDTLSKYWQAIYGSVAYEGLHLLDPEMEWDLSEEQKVVRKTDIHAITFALIAFICLNIDRTNMKTAITGTFFGDVGINNDDYNLGTTINLFCFLAAELPSSVISKRVGPDRFIPLQMTLWSVAVILQSMIRSRTSFLCMRAIVGILEGGFIPVISLWLSYFYTGPELALRLGIFYIANPLVQALTSLMAFAIFHMENIGNLAGWQWIFILEGSLTLFVGLASFFFMTASPSQTKSLLCPQGWYNRRQEKIVVNRILRDDPTKGSMNNRQQLSLRDLRSSVMNVDMWPIYLVRVLGDISSSAIGLYQPIILRTAGFSTFETNLLMIPNQLLAIFSLLLIAWLTSRYKRYSIFMLITPLWIIPCLVLLKLNPDILLYKWRCFIILFVIALSGPHVTPMSVSWCSHNSGDVGLRTVSTALVNMFSQAGGIIAANVFRGDIEHLSSVLQHGVTTLLEISLLSMTLILLSNYWYQWKNHQKEKVWNSMVPEEKANYLQKTRDKGNKRLDFRFVR